MSKKEYAATKNAAFLAGVKARREEGGLRSEGPGEFATAPGRTAERQEREWLQEQLALARDSAIELGLLHEVAGRKRHLSPEQFGELKDNIARHGLISAITVRTREQGGFEIVSGHNRVAALRELGEKTVKAIVVDGDEARATLHAFYANLIQPSLPDFEKFLGFQNIEDVTKKSRKEMAEDAGVAPSMVTLWFSFADLPPEAIEMIRTAPEKLGATAASALSKLTRLGRGDQVTHAVKELIEGKITQAQAIVAATRDDGKKPVKAKKARRIMRGKEVYAEISSGAATLRITFLSETERSRVELLINALLLQQSTIIGN